jgi:hypothetical protein
MKQFTIIVAFTMFFGGSVFGHGGRTDKDGGHYNHKTGKYHHHNGGGSNGLIGLLLVGGVAYFFFTNKTKRK